MKFTEMRKKAVAHVFELSKLGLTIEQIARKTGFSVAHVYRLIRDERKKNNEQ